MLSAALCVAFLSGTLGEQEAQRACAVARTIVLAANKYDVPAARLVCVAHVETRWKDIRGSSGECGVTQVLPSTTWSCASLRDPNIAIERTAQLLHKSNLWYRLARRYCGKDAKCLAQHTLMGYNAGTAAAQHKGRKLKRALAYAENVLACEDSMHVPPPDFFAEIPVESAKPGDRVWFYADKGGWRPGTVDSIVNSAYMMVKADGRLKAEKVKVTKITNAYRDIFVEKEKI